MKINTILMLQSFGCGDILWEQSIAQDFIDEGYKVLWPVDAVYAPLAKHFPNITMIDKSLVNVNWGSKDDYVINGCRIIPMRFTDSICGVPYTDCMKSKYQYLGKDWTKWKDNCKIVRDAKNEDKLYYEILGLKDGEKYNLVSEQWGTGGNRSNPLKVDNGLRNVNMTLIGEFTIIDWLKTIQNATNIYAIASSNIYLFELFELQAKEVHIFVRFPIEKDHENYSYILTKPNYILHG